ncbi:MAG: ABC transporter permease subunit [Candidatus Hatepunaea meridiana]|nr:ABC transporter permease subunit [Candidatus Hatepunaea meridiana]
MAENINQEEYKSVSLFRKRIKRFKKFKRGYYSFYIILVMYIASFFAPFIMSNKALIVKYEGETYFPVLKYHSGKEFGQDVFGEADYRALKLQLKQERQGNWVLMPLYPYGPYESLTDPTKEPPNPPSPQHLFGTDDRGRDVFVRLAYGFNISISFALVLIAVCYFVGICIGAALGYYGGWFDIVFQRIIEIWQAMPFLFIVIIISAIIQPNFSLLVGIAAFFGWMGMTYFMRGEFYREKAKDYVQAAVSMGASDRIVIFKHILPNALTPVISFAPFTIVGYIGFLVSLDYLGFGLPPPTPSWGELVSQGMGNIFSWWLVLFPLGALFVTLLLVVFIGESVRNAFDPREYSRLR